MFPNTQAVAYILHEEECKTRRQELDEAIGGGAIDVLVECHKLLLRGAEVGMRRLILSELN